MNSTNSNHSNKELLQYKKLLKEADFLNKKLINSTKAVVIKLCLNGNITSISKGAEQVLGYKNAELLNVNWFNKFYSVSDAKIYKDLFQQFILSTKKTKNIVCVITTRGGELKRFKWSKTKRFENGKLIEIIAVGNNITEIYTSKTILKESEINFKKFAELSPNPIAIIKTDGTITFINSKFEKLFGFKFKEIPNINSLFKLSYDNNNIAIKKAHQLFINDVTNLTNGKKVVTNRIYGFAKYGKPIIIDYIAILFQNLIYYAYRDVTIEVNAENTLKENINKFQKIFEYTPIATVVCDYETLNAQFTNAKFEEIFGYRYPDKYKFNDWVKLIVPENNEQKKFTIHQWKTYFTSTIDNISSTNPFFTCLIKTANNKVRKFEVGITKVDKSIYVFFYDITQRGEALKAIEESEKKFKALAENMPVAIGAYTTKGETVFLNKFFEEKTGYQLNDISTINKWYKKTQPKLAKRIELKNFWMNMISEFRKGNITNIPEVKASIKCKNGEIKYFEFAFSIYNELNYILLNDITLQQKAKKELESSHQKLRELAAHQRSIREDERKSISRDLHDELGQQLTGIKLEVSAIFKKIKANKKIPESDLKEVIKLLNGSVNSVRKISTKIRPSILDNLGLIAAIEWQVEEFINRTGVNCKFVNEFKLKLNNSIFETKLFRILQESLTNIMRHAKAKNVLIELSEQNNCLNLLITDDGIGFDKTKQTRSLGLLGMQERIFILGGNLNIESSIGNGTLIKINVPIKN